MNVVAHLYLLSPTHSQFCAKWSSKPPRCVQVRNSNPAFCLFLGLLPLSLPSPSIHPPSPLCPPTAMVSHC